ncbi:MAG: IS110 family transposase [Candidatus Omnitrophota bacterium]
MESIAYVGNDVHKETITVAVYEGYSKEPVIEQKINNEKARVQKFYLNLKKTKGYKIKSCYEASGCGYVFHRWLKEIGVECEIIAPSSIPSKNRKIKTDKIDAKKLAKHYRNNDLTIVHVPTEKEESIRGITRLREQLKKGQKKTKQHILKFLQLKGITYKEGSNWTQKHVRFLEGLKFEKIEDEFIFNRYKEMLEHTQMEVKAVDEKIKEIAFKDEMYKSRVGKLRCFRGIDTTTSMGLITEIVDFRRFGNPKEMMSYVGLIPGEESSGETRKMKGITKAGNKRVRRLLVEAAWHYRHRPAQTDVLKERQKGQEISVINHCWKAQKRLNKKFYNLFSKGKCKQKTVTAVARELIGFIWAVMNDKTEPKLTYVLDRR